jgi:hypothetical protein
MRIAILLGANPRTHTKGSLSVLKPGKWKIASETLVDSVISVSNHSLKLSLHDEFELSSYTSFTGEFLNRGSEQIVSVYAERL